MIAVHIHRFVLKSRTDNKGNDGAGEPLSMLTVGQLWLVFAKRVAFPMQRKQDALFMSSMSVFVVVEYLDR